MSLRENHMCINGGCAPLREGPAIVYTDSLSLLRGTLNGTEPLLKRGLLISFLGSYCYSSARELCKIDSTKQSWFTFTVGLQWPISSSSICAWTGVQLSSAPCQIDVCIGNSPKNKQRRWVLILDWSGRHSNTGLFQGCKLKYIFSNWWKPQVSFTRKDPEAYTSSKSCGSLKRTRPALINDDLHHLSIREKEAIPINQSEWSFWNKS